MCALQVTFLLNVYRGALYSNLHTYDFGDGDAAPSVDNSPGHWRRSLCHPFVRGGGGGGSLSIGGEVLCPSFKQKDDANIAASAGDTFALRGNGDF